MRPVSVYLRPTTVVEYTLRSLPELRHIECVIQPRHDNWTNVARIVKFPFICRTAGHVSAVPLLRGLLMLARVDALFDLTQMKMSLWGRSTVRSIWCAGCSIVQADKTLKICLAKKIPVDRNYIERTVLLSLTAPHSTMGNITDKCFWPIQLGWEVFPVFTIYIW